MGSRASSSWPTTPTCSSTEARRRRRAGTPTGRSAARTSGSSRSGLESPAPLAARGTAADAARRDRAGAGGHGPGRVGGHVPCAAVRGSAGGQRVHPDRHEPLERLLGRPSRCRHRGPARPGARDGRRPDASPACARGHLRGLRRGGGGGPLPRRGGRLGAARGGCRLDPRRRALHGRPAPVRIRGARRAVRVPVLRPCGRGGVLFRPDGGAALGGRGAGRAGGAARRGHPGGEQRARRRHRPPRGEANPRGEARARARAHAVRGDGGHHLSDPRRARTRSFGLAAAPARRAAAGAAACPHRQDQLGWTGAERGPRRHGPVACGVLAAPGRGRAPLVSTRVERSVLKLSIPLKEPFVTSGGVVSARELLLLRLEARDGAVGYGEAAPFEPYDGVPLERAAAALTGGGGRRPPQARAAEEIARLDLHARQEERPLAEPRKDALAVNMTLAAGPRDGYACFKLKVGLPDDVDRVAAVREAIGPWPALRVDANGAWTVDEAVHAIRGIEGNDLELVEQPCRTLRELAEVRQRVSTAIAADESVSTLRELRRAAELEACDVVNVKVAGSGGFKPARELLREARAAGMDVFLSSTLDGPWGIAASLQLAAAEELTLACGLATLPLFDSLLARALPAPRAGTLSVPPGPGLGLSIEEEDLAAVTLATLP